MEILMLNHHFLSQKNFCTILVDGEPPLIHILICDLVVVVGVFNDLKDLPDFVISLLMAFMVKLKLEEGRRSRDHSN